MLIDRPRRLRPSGSILALRRLSSPFTHNRGTPCQHGTVTSHFLLRRLQPHARSLWKSFSKSSRSLASSTWGLGTSLITSTTLRVLKGSAASFRATDRSE